MRILQASDKIRDEKQAHNVSYNLIYSINLILGIKGTLYVTIEIVPPGQILGDLNDQAATTTD